MKIKPPKQMPYELEENLRRLVLTLTQLVKLNPKNELGKYAKYLLKKIITDLQRHFLTTEL